MMTTTIGASFLSAVRASWIVAALYAVMMCTAPASASNLVTNPGFETGDITGWTESFSFFCFSSVGGVAHSGSFGYGNGTAGTQCSLEQLLPTDGGASYDISFWLFNTGGTPNSFQAYWEGDLLTSLIDIPFATINPGENDFLFFSFTRTASSNDVLLSFVFQHDPIYWVLDDVSVTQVSGVPEPSGWALTIAGLALLALGNRRRSRRALRVE